MRLFFLCCLLIGSTFSFSQSSYSLLGLDPELKKNADAVVRLERTRVEIGALDDVSVLKTRAVTILKQRGNSHARAFVSYDKTKKIRKLEARIFNFAGKEIEKFKMRDFLDMSAVPGGTLYSDDRVKYLDYTPVTYPYTIEISYELSFPDTALIPSWYPQSDYHVSVARSEYEVVFNSPELKPDTAIRNMEDINLLQESATGKLSFQVTNLPALKQEPYSFPMTFWAPRVMVRMPRFRYDSFEGKSSDWAELGQWMYHQVLHGRDELPDATITLIRSLVEGVEDPMEKARIVYRYVQENTRYISVQVGIGGIQPITAAEVDRLKYGDCKGLTNYTMALLDAVNVPSYYTHVEAGSDKVDLDPEFADLAQGNHVILAIPDGDGYHWVDCTSQTNPFGYLGSFTDDRLVHVIREDGGEILRTPAYLDDDNSLNTQATMILDESGRLEGKASMVSRFLQYENRSTVETLAPDERDLSYKKYWGYVNNISVTEVAYEHHKEAREFIEELKFSADHYATHTGDLLFLHPNVLNRFTHIPDRVRDRSREFRVARGFTDRDQYRIKLPQNMQLQGLPEPIAIEGEFGNYRMEVSFDPAAGELLYVREFALRHGTWPKEEYQVFRDFCKAVSQADNSQVVLKKIQTSNQ